MLLSEDADGFNNRQLMDFPPERELYLSELQVPVPDTIPKLKDIYQVLHAAHKEPQQYTLHGDAYTAFETAHDAIVNRKQATDDENIQGILSKSKGYTARLAMILHALEQTISHLDSQSTDQSSTHMQPILWCTAITPKAVEAADKILTNLTAQKIIMLDRSQDAIDSLPASDQKRLTKALRLPTPEGTIRPYILCQKGIIHPAPQAERLLNLAQDYGFGHIDSVTAANNKTTNIFRKRRYAELSEIAKNRLKKLKVSQDEYERTFSM